MIYPKIYLDKKIQEEKIRTCRTGSPFTLIHFFPEKLFSNGSKPKKKDIKKISKIVDLSTRTTDIAGWWNSKTLVIILLDTPAEGGYVYIEKLVTKIKDFGYEITNPEDGLFYKIYIFPNADSNGKNINYIRKQEKSRSAMDSSIYGKNCVDKVMDKKSVLEGMTLDFKSRYFYLIKCCIDILLTIILLIMLMPVFIICFVAIKLDSPGPVIYAQKRVGKKGKVFNFYKFRTMNKNCDQSIHKQHINKLVNGQSTLSRNGKSNDKTYKLINDRRVTKIGKILRKTSIDELPQLFNVIKGEMSLVGPRPHPLYEVELYNQWCKYRLDIKPGITGLGQVRGRYNKKYEDVYRLDLRYVKNATLLLDIKILFKTIFVVFSFKGAN